MSDRLLETPHLELVLALEESVTGLIRVDSTEDARRLALWLESGTVRDELEAWIDAFIELAERAA